MANAECICEQNVLFYALVVWNVFVNGITLCVGQPMRNVLMNCLANTECTCICELNLLLNSLVVRNVFMNGMSLCISKMDNAECVCERNVIVN